MRYLDMAELRSIAAGHDYPLVFAAVSGAHLYGFPSTDSDVDIRGAHVLPVEEVIGLRRGRQTVDRSWDRAGAEIDLVTHAVDKFGRLLLSRNGYVLEQLLSPLVVTTGAAHAELVDLAPGCLTLHHAHHYRGFATNQWTLFERSGELKPLLYTFRVLLTGIHLMRSGEVVADLRALVELVAQSPAYLDDLIVAKAAGEHHRLEGLAVIAELSTDVDRLHRELDQAQRSSSLPDAATAQDQLHDLLVRVRLGASDLSGRT